MTSRTSPPRARGRRPSPFRPALQVLEDRTNPSGSGWAIQADPDGHVFVDSNENGVFDAGEAGLAGWTVWLDLNVNGVIDPGEPAQATDDTGHYSFDTTNLPYAYTLPNGDPADVVRVDLQVGSGGRWVNTTSTDVAIDRATTPWATGVDWGVVFRPTVGVAPLGPESRANVTTAGQQFGSSSGASVSADSAGNYVVAWYTPQADGTDAVCAGVFNADGTPRTGDIFVATAAQVHNSAIDSTSGPRMAMAGNGDFLVAWQSTTLVGGQTVSSVYARAYHPDGTPAGGQTTILAATSKLSGSLMGAAADATGDFAVAYTTTAIRGPYTNPPTILVQRYTASGAANGKAITVANPNLINSNVGIAMDGAGDFVVTWNDFNGGTIYVYAQRYSSAGRKLGSQVTLASAPNPTVLWHPEVAMNAAGRYAIAWGNSTTGREMVQVFNADGTPAGAVVAFAPTSMSETAGGLAIDGAGNVTLVWSPDIPWGNPPGIDPFDGSEVRVQRLTAAGVLEPATIANTTTQGRQALPGVAAIGGGQFVVVWDGYGPGDDQGIFSQRYAPIT